jgi:hypothetical protein
MRTPHHIGILKSMFRAKAVPITETNRNPPNLIRKKLQNRVKKVTNVCYMQLSLTVSTSETI